MCWLLWSIPIVLLIGAVTGIIPNDGPIKGE